MHAGQSCANHNSTKLKFTTVCDVSPRHLGAPGMMRGLHPAGKQGTRLGRGMEAPTRPRATIAAVSDTSATIEALIKLKAQCEDAALGVLENGVGMLDKRLAARWQRRQEARPNSDPKPTATPQFFNVLLQNNAKMFAPHWFWALGLDSTCTCQICISKMQEHSLPSLPRQSKPCLQK